MRTLEQPIADLDERVLELEATRDADAALQAIARRDGLGVAVTAAWYHGLRHRHIPTTLGTLTAEQAATRVIDDAECPFTFVHVPVRRYRSDRAALVDVGIVNPAADPASFVYHEDGLVSVLSFPQPRPLSLSDRDVRSILDTLARARVLTPANLNNRQVQFKDARAKRLLERSRERVYVVRRLPMPGRDTLPDGFDQPEVWSYLLRHLVFRRECNYCSVAALNPREVTLHSQEAADVVPGDHDTETHRLATVRNYQFGFTFAPFGDPREVCHFVAWDFPHISDLVMNMEPQLYSFSDLIKLVRVINDDIERFARKHDVPVPEPISGACNHWAGNSIYHQHYQFFRLPRLPLRRATTRPEPLAQVDGVQVLRVGDDWPVRAYLVTAVDDASDEAVMQVADRVAQEWRMLGDGEDTSYGNGIAVQNHTQNTLVTMEDGRLVAVFIPRERRRTSTSDPANVVQKNNAGVLEMAGYFVIDSPEDFDQIASLSPQARAALACNWLRELSPSEAELDDFERHVRICLRPMVRDYEERITALMAPSTPDALRGGLRSVVSEVASQIQRSPGLDHEERAHLYRQLLAALLESGGEEASA
jgi:hypothetical protein